MLASAGNVWEPLEDEELVQADATSPMVATATAMRRPGVPRLSAAHSFGSRRLGKTLTPGPRAPRHVGGGPDPVSQHL